MKKFQVLAQVVGFVVIAMLAIYGLASMVGGPEVLWAAAGLAAPHAPQEVQAVPTTMNYQGMLRDETGQPLDGVYTMTFRIYPTVISTQTLWSEEHISVTVRDGHFGVLLGDSAPLDASLFASPDRYIGVTVDPFDEMLPRQRFVSVPYTFYAQNAELAYGLSAADGDPADAVTVDNDGHVTVGGDISAANLTTSGEVFAGRVRAYGNGPQWAGITTSGGPTSTLIMGQLYGKAVIGGHNGNLVGWNDLMINPEAGANGGNVGIGTYNPTEKLDVNGNINVSNNITAGNLSTSGDIGWSGNLTGFSIVDDYLSVYNVNDSKVISGVDHANSVCFISKMTHNSPVAGTRVECGVTYSGGQWVIDILGQDTGAIVGCGARCLEW